MRVKIANVIPQFFQLLKNEDDDNVRNAGANVVRELAKHGKSFLLISILHLW